MLVARLYEASDKNTSRSSAIQPTQNPDATPSSPTSTAPTPEDDSLGIDREFLVKMAQMPILALGWVAAGLLAHKIWAAFSPTGLNGGPLLVLSFGMILAAFIDGWALKVPNWVTLPLVLSGWLLGLLHDCGVHLDSGTGGLGMAFGCTVFGFLLLFPMLAIGGVGEGDVKMQMGFGAWVGAFFGEGETTEVVGLAKLYAPAVVFWGFAFGAIVGGLCGLVIIFIRRQWKANRAIVAGIADDMKKFASGNVSEATAQAHERRKSWVKLPYGIPLCIGFLLFLSYKLILEQ